MLTEYRGGKLNRFNDPDVNRKTKAENKKTIYEQMEKGPSEHAKKFFKMEGYQHIKGKGKRTMKIDILGTEYEILFQTDQENIKLKDSNGLCEQYSKEIIIENPDVYNDEPMAVSNIKELTNKVIRHEIIHAFLGESGLRNNSEWAQNEEMVDWIAIQFPKIQKVFEKLNCL